MHNLCVYMCWLQIIYTKKNVSYFVRKIIINHHLCLFYSQWVEELENKFLNSTSFEKSILNFKDGMNSDKVDSLNTYVIEGKKVIWIVYI